MAAADAVVEEAVTVVEAEAEVAAEEVRTKTSLVKIQVSQDSQDSLGEPGQEVQDIRISLKAMDFVICISAGVEEHFSVLIQAHAHGRMSSPRNNETGTSSVQ